MRLQFAALIGAVSIMFASITAAAVIDEPSRSDAPDAQHELRQVGALMSTVHADRTAQLRRFYTGLAKEDARRRHEAAERAAARAAAAEHAAEAQQVVAASVAPAVPYTPAPAPAPAAVSGGVWAALRGCESGGNYAANTGNGFFGAYQFTISTWNSMGTGYARADLAPLAVQDAAAQRLAQRANPYTQWPVCWPRAVG